MYLCTINLVLLIFLLMALLPLCSWFIYPFTASFFFVNTHPFQVSVSLSVFKTSTWCSLIVKDGFMTQGVTTGYQTFDIVPLHSRTNILWDTGYPTLFIGHRTPAPANISTSRLLIDIFTSGHNYSVRHLLFHT